MKPSALLPRASLLVLALAALGTGCIAEPPRTLIVGGSGDASGTTDDGSGGSGSGATTGEGAGQTTGVGAGTTTGVGAGTTTGAGAGGQTPQGTFDFSIDDDTPSSNLMDETAVHVTITPQMGFAGTVDLSATGLPEGVSVTFDDASPYVAGGAKTVTATLHVAETVPVGDSALTLSAHAGTITHEADATITVNPTITLHIPNGVLNLGGTPGNPYRTAYGPYPIVIHAQGNMITVNFMNDDSVSHQIHSGGTFGHDPGSIPAHQMDSYVRHVPNGQYDFYLHDQGSSATPGQIIVQ